MENIKQYIDNNSGLQIAKRHQNPWISIAILVCGVILVVLSRTLHHHDSLQMTLISVGIIAAIVGSILLAVCCCSANSYLYQPTRSKMKMHHFYINNVDCQLLKEMLATKEMDNLKNILPEMSTNTMLDVMISADGCFTLLQVLEYGSCFEPTTPVCVLSGDAAQEVKRWVKA